MPLRAALDFLTWNKKEESDESSPIWKEQCASELSQFRMKNVLIKSSPFQMKNVRIKSSSEECRMQNDDAEEETISLLMQGRVPQLI